MTRHSKNCTAGTVYSYHERKRDEAASGYGSTSLRFGKDSLKEFDCCCLTLQPCRDPVITPDGYIFDKESILEYILQKKKEIARQMKAFSKQQNKAAEELAELSKAEQEAKKEKFISKVSAPSEDLPSSSTSNGVASISNMKETKAKELPSFWIPCMTPDPCPSFIKKPDEKVRCPMSDKPLRLKDLIPVKFTGIKDRDSKTSLIAKQARYVCAVTNDVLGNSVPCAVLRTSGNVVTMECVEKLIKKDMMDPITGQKLSEKDIIPLNRGASSFAGAGNQLEAKKPGPSMQA